MTTINFTPMQHILFLRAINVSGSRVIKMQDLRTMLEAIPGISNVKTYIQSGNVILDAKGTDTDKLAAKIEKHLAKALGHDMEAFIRTTEELQAIADNNPYPAKENHTLYITFLRTTPDKALVKALIDKSTAVDQFAVSGREVYTFVDKTAPKSIFTNMMLEKHFKQQGTGRNLNTVHKMLALAGK
jgi:Uncharacterized protein conserved in bacteria